MNNYDDIINLPHHVSKNHPRMSIENRASQFSPFSALTGYEDAINESRRITTEKRILTPDKIEELNRILLEIEDNLNKYTYQITYFKKDLKKVGGNYLTIIDKIIKINPTEEYLITKSKIKIKLNDIEEIIKLDNEQKL